MDISIVSSEMTSMALKEIAGSIDETIENLKKGKVVVRQASVEIAGAKHVLQALALDWMYHRPRLETSKDSKRTSIE